MIGSKIYAQKAITKFDNLDGNGSNNNSLITAEIFCQLVALNLPINDWPKIPDETCLTPTIERMRVRETHNLINLLNKSFGVSKIDNRAKRNNYGLMNRREYYRQASEAFHFVIYIILKGLLPKRASQF